MIVTNIRNVIVRLEILKHTMTKIVEIPRDKATWSDLHFRELEL